MRVDVKVIPRASRNSVKTEGARLKVYVTAPAEKNRANHTVVEILARHFRVKKRAIKIVRGEHAFLKTVEIQV
ncbi:MAG: DUF167 domain-containing protein [Candidatus Omnitrophota bacterium]